MFPPTHAPISISHWLWKVTKNQWNTEGRGSNSLPPTVWRRVTQLSHLLFYIHVPLHSSCNPHAFMQELIFCLIHHTQSPVMHMI